MQAAIPPVELDVDNLIERLLEVRGYFTNK